MRVVINADAALKDSETIWTALVAATRSSQFVKGKRLNIKQIPTSLSKRGAQASNDRSGADRATDDSTMKKSSVAIKTESDHLRPLKLRQNV
jgi:hypothetical protein